MKNIFISVLLLSTTLVCAQLKLNTSGNLGLGTDPNSTHRLNLLGNSLFEGTNTLNGFARINGVTIHSGPTFHLTAQNTYPGVVLSAGSSFNCLYLLCVEGDAFSSGSWVGSDLLLKKDISTLDGESMLTKIRKLDGKKFAFKNNDELLQTEPFSTSDLDEQFMNLPEGIRYGFIAQEIEQEFPELVKTDPTTQLKAINYDGMTAVLLQCIKEQQKQIEKLEEMIYGSVSFKSLKTKGNNTPAPALEAIEENELFQNTPNPFITSTEIRFNIKPNTTNAFIGIYDMNGTQIKLEKIHLSGKGSIFVEPNELKPGMYLYSLIVDNSLIDTKTMVLTD